MLSLCAVSARSAGERHGPPHVHSLPRRLLLQRHWSRRVPKVQPGNRNSLGLSSGSGWSDLGRSLAGSLWNHARPGLVRGCQPRVRVPRRRHDHASQVPAVSRRLLFVASPILSQSPSCWPQRHEPAQDGPVGVRRVRIGHCAANRRAWVRFLTRQNLLLHSAFCLQILHPLRGRQGRQRQRPDAVQPLPDRHVRLSRRHAGLQGTTIGNPVKSGCSFCVCLAVPCAALRGRFRESVGGRQQLLCLHARLVRSGA
jgi:hypothetical protein